MDRLDVINFLTGTQKVHARQVSAFLAHPDVRNIERVMIGTLTSYRHAHRRT